IRDRVKLKLSQGLLSGIQAIYIHHIAISILLNPENKEGGNAICFLGRGVGLINLKPKPIK
ncbi:MAG: hypothetical protein NTU99_00585, partial [Pseudanabaena sp. LacPavin_0818_WC45_MAG_42_6]|nr:hypothetical protein [Pseudanabaena sp. LacPavin_0818_WC45_MAG_42_6]